MDKNNRKKFMKNFDTVKKKYDEESKERTKERIVNEIKKIMKKDVDVRGKLFLTPNTF